MDVGHEHDAACDLCALTEASDVAGTWMLSYRGFDRWSEGTREALLTLANGYLGTRGALSEAKADDVHYPGVYVAGVYNRLVSMVDGMRHEDESMVNLPNWTPVTFRIDDGDWFSPTSSFRTLHHHVGLDLRAGLLLRESVLVDDRGRRTRMRQRRMVSMHDPHLAVIDTTFYPENWSGTLSVQSGIDGAVRNRNVPDLHHFADLHLYDVTSGTVDPDIVWLEAVTRQSQVRVAVAARTRMRVDGMWTEPRRSRRFDSEAISDVVSIDVSPGQSIEVEKTVSVYTSRDRAISEPGLATREAVQIAHGFDDLFADHAEAWDGLWRRFQLSLESYDIRTMQATNVVIFHVLQTLSPHTAELDVGVPARGLHGEAYRGHIFWDEMFVFPFLNLRLPELTRALLLYRFRRLPYARRLAGAEGLQGALFPWQSGSDGREETPQLLFNPRSGRWMPDNSRRQYHVNLAVAYNVWHCWEATADLGFLATYGAEMLVDNARFWVSLVVHDEQADRFDIRGVMGPDEFHDGYPDRPGMGIDNVAYVNVMVAWSLARALDAHRILGENEDVGLWRRLELTEDELRHWDYVRRRLRLCFLDNGLLSQFEGYELLAELDWDAYRARYGNIGRLDLILEAEGDSCIRYRASKQADVLMLLYLFSAEELTTLIGDLGYAFDPASIPATVEYYLARTSHGSTLSRVAHAWVLARADRRGSWQMLNEALESDLSDIQGGTTREGVHLGAMAGSIDILQRCYSGFDIRGDVLWLHPLLPDELYQLEFDIRYRDHWIHLRCDHENVSVSTKPSAAPPIRVNIHGSEYELAAGDRVTVAAQYEPETPGPWQPVPPGAAREVEVGVGTDGTTADIDVTAETGLLPAPEGAGRGAIVVGIDDSEQAFDALHWAADIAARRRVPLHVAHVLPTPGVYMSEAAVLVQARVSEQLEDAARQVLVRARKELAVEHPGVAVTTGTYPGPPAVSLLEAAEGALLLVLGASGSGALGTALVGSTGQRVATHAPCPVVVCRGGRIPDDVDRPVVVGVDGSDSSVDAVRAAFDFAALVGGRVVVAHAWGPDRPVERYGTFRLVDWALVETEERAVLAESVAGYASEYPDVPVIERLERGNAGKLLVELSEQARLVVVGSRGHSGLAGALLGSTSQNLLHHAKCPVMICRHR